MRALPLNCWHHWSFRLLKLNDFGVAKKQQQRVPTSRSLSRLMKFGARRQQQRQERGYWLDATLQRGVIRLERMISPVILGKSWTRRNNWAYEIDVCNVIESHNWATKLTCQRDLKFVSDSGLVENSMTPQSQIPLCIWPLTLSSEWSLHYHLHFIVTLEISKIPFKIQTRSEHSPML